MRKWMIYFMLFTYLISSIEVRQIAKLPDLIGHYITHKTDNPDISLYAFFKMHYLDEQIKDKDYDEDMKLPFKKHDFSSISITLNIPPEKAFLNINQSATYVGDLTNFSYSEKFYPSIFQTIWEPPKI